MEKDEVALEIRDGSEVLRYSGKDCALIIYLFIYLRISFFFFFLFSFFFQESTTYQVEKTGNKSYSYL